jgi:hypothetical protein
MQETPTEAMLFDFESDLGTTTTTTTTTTPVPTIVHDAQNTSALAAFQVLTFWRTRALSGFRLRRLRSRVF